MNQGTDYFVHSQVTGIQSRCAYAMRVIERADSLAQIAREVQVSMPSYLRSLVQRDVHQLQQAGERRAQTLLKAQFAELDALAGTDLATRLHVLRTNQWRFLGGNFPRLAQEANRRGIQYHQRAVATTPPRGPAPGLDPVPAWYPVPPTGSA